MSTNPLSFLLNCLLPLLPLSLLPLLALLSLLAHSAGPWKIQSHTHVVICCYTIIYYVVIYCHTSHIFTCVRMLSYNHIFTWSSYDCGQKGKKRKPASSLPAGSLLLSASFYLHLYILVYRNNTFVSVSEKDPFISRRPSASPDPPPSACCAPAPPAPEVPHLGF